MPGTFFGDCLTGGERQVMNELRQILSPETVNSFSADITAIRRSILSADAWRSFWVIAAGMIILMIYRAGKLKPTWMVAAVTLLCLVDMWGVNRRYLNNGMFVDPLQKEQVFAKTETDEQILQDKSLDYRVLNFSSDTFNENETSYWHKSIGGYHAAKLGRYQDLISHCIAPEMQALMKVIPQAGGDFSKFNADSVCPTINMLNGKYFILPLQQGKTVPLQNPCAYGNAWFVGKLTYVDGAQAEMSLLKKINRRVEAVADKEFEKELGAAYENAAADTTAKITLTAYEPNELTYKLASRDGGVVVLSEIYYPGWTATLDGKDIPIGRADYVLRALRVPAGQHTLVLKFDPQSLHTTEAVAYAALAVMLLALAAAVAVSLRRKKGRPAGK